MQSKEKAHDTIDNRGSAFDVSLDLTRELSALEGIPYWKWQRIKACVDALFDQAQKENVLAVNKDILRSKLVVFRKGEL